VADATAARGRVLIAGTINTDLVARVRAAPAAGETVTGRDFAIFPGGKAANQAVAAARSGAPTAMLGAVGEDDFGRARRADLVREGIDVADVAETSLAASGVALIFVEESGENRIVYVPGATATVSAAQATAALRRVRPAVVLLTAELPLPALQALVASARQLGATVVVNAAPEPSRVQEIARQADVLIVNQTEARELLGTLGANNGWADVARDLAMTGPRGAIVTCGADGAILWHEGNLTELPAPQVDVVDTTGAGDAFCGAFAAALAGGTGVDEAARAAVVAGSLAVTKPGAQPSMPTLAEIERFREQATKRSG